MALDVLQDYDAVQAELKDGMYILPDTMDLSIWHGSFFVPSGIYENGIFRFIICIHPEYPGPGAMPLVVFLDRPYHPLVHAETGLLQLEAAVGQTSLLPWDFNTRLPKAVAYIRSALTQAENLQLRAPLPFFNAIAAAEFRSAHDRFIAKAQASAAAAARAAVVPPMARSLHARHTASTSDGAAEARQGGRGGAALAGGGAMNEGSLRSPNLDQMDTLDGEARWEMSPYTGALVPCSLPTDPHPPAPLPPNLKAAAVPRDLVKTASVAEAIGRRRGFRLSEGSIARETLLHFLRDAPLQREHVTSLLLRGLPEDADQYKYRYRHREPQPAHANDNNDDNDTDANDNNDDNDTDANDNTGNDASASEQSHPMVPDAEKDDEGKPSLPRVTDVDATDTATGDHALPSSASAVAAAAAGEAAGSEDTARATALVELPHTRETDDDLRDPDDAAHSASVAAVSSHTSSSSISSPSSSSSVPAAVGNAISAAEESEPATSDAGAAPACDSDTSADAGGDAAVPA